MAPEAARLIRGRPTTGRDGQEGNVFDLGTLFALNLLLAVLSIPFLWDLVPRNRFYGFRVPATLRDDQVWYTMNRRVARAMIPVCSVLALAAAVFERVGLDTPFGRTLLSVITLTALGVITFSGWSAGNRLERFKQSARPS